MRRTDEEGKAVEETWRSKRQIAKDEGEKSDKMKTAGDRRADAHPATKSFLTQLEREALMCVQGKSQGNLKHFR